MTSSVSRGSVVVLAGGQKPCSRCAARPRAPGQRYCKPCHAEYKRDWKEGKVSMMLTPAERELILEYRREHGQ